MQFQTGFNYGGECMGYETKVILVAVADIIETSKSLDEAFERISRLANVEGVIVERHPKEKSEE
jgi:hypothetical protein